MVSVLLTTTTFFNPVQDCIPLVEARMREQSNGHHEDLAAALDHLLSSGGKRIRPVVALLTGSMLGADPDLLITLAAAIELLHTATLVHDDLIDGSLLRRGYPTLNAKWSPAATVLTGDFIFARAAKLAAETNSVEVMSLFAQTLATIVNGEITQLFVNHAPISRQDYFDRIYAKTASMFELASTAAAILSQVSEDDQEAMHNYGYEIGMAFQIVDDVLDFTGEQETVGKPVANDLRQGLITLPAIIYLETHPEDPNGHLFGIGNYFNEERVMGFAKAIRESSAIDKALEEARAFAERGLNALATFPASPERNALEDLANFIVHRHL
jgi:geranylgeranyl pyrophosphate synthase